MNLSSGPDAIFCLLAFQVRHLQSWKESRGRDTSLAIAAQEVHSRWLNAVGLLTPSESCALQPPAMHLFHAMDTPLLPSKDFSEMGTCALEFFNMQA